MDETMQDATTEELNEQINSIEDETATVEESSKDPLKEAIEEQLRKVRRQNILIGAQTSCRVIFDMIIAAENQPGKRTMNDYKRLIKKVKDFCVTGISRKINLDGETESIEDESTKEETVQN